MTLNNEIEIELKKSSVDFHYFIDISHLPESLNKNYPKAILFGILLSKDYLLHVYRTVDYVNNMMKSNTTYLNDEFYLKELMADNLADDISALLKNKGFDAFSLSEKNQIESDLYDKINKEMPLPHKTVAKIAEIGWIGKNNLLVTKEYGCGFCLGVVLTNAPVQTNLNNSTLSKCGNCSVCFDICPSKALTGNLWNINSKKSDMINVEKCTTCLKCLAHCPWTQRYINSVS